MHSGLGVGMLCYSNTQPTVYLTPAHYALNKEVLDGLSSVIILCDTINGDAVNEVDCIWKMSEKATNINLTVI